MLLKDMLCYTAFSEFYIKWHVAFMVDFVIFLSVCSVSVLLLPILL